jgi:hypothetical protein
MRDTTSNEKAEPHVIRLKGVPSAEAFGTITLWSTYSYAPEWFADASREATMSGHEARRREILFATCAAESYIFEWVRDTVLNRDFNALEIYFVPAMRRGVKEKFRDIPKQLATDGRISGSLDCSGHEWQEFQALVAFRDGLVHAGASRPETEGLAPGNRPIPSKKDLDSLPAGWAIAIVRARLQKLHADTTTARPGWF